MTTYIPSYLSKCAPTLDLVGYWRGNSILRCQVHDPTAWIMGGICGNAGIFTTHTDLIKFMTMYLQKGVYTASDGSQQRLFLNSTIDLFTTAPNNLPYNNTRALGWDTIPN